MFAGRRYFVYGQLLYPRQRPKAIGMKDDRALKIGAPLLTANRIRYSAMIPRSSPRYAFATSDASAKEPTSLCCLSMLWKKKAAEQTSFHSSHM